MTTRPYDDCLTLTLAMCGIPDANTAEVARINAFMNGRARRAYAACRYWPRYLKVEERVCSEDGILPYEQDGLDTIKEVLRVHATEPYQRCGAVEYANFVSIVGGYQITGYVGAEYSGYAPMRLTGASSPNINGVYNFSGLGSLGADGVTQLPIWNWEGDPDYQIAGYGQYVSTIPPELTGYSWVVGVQLGSDFWQSSYSLDFTSPELATGAYVGIGGVSGDIAVEKIETFGVWVTYKAAFTDTYSAGGEIPEEWADYIIYGSYADWLRSEGQQDKAILAEQEARPYLDDQLEVLDRQSGSHVFTRVINHGNMQPR